METTIERENGILVAKASGRVDGSNALEFQDTLEKSIGAEDKVVILNLGQLSYISSAGLRVVLLIAKSLQSRNTEFAVCELQERIYEVFQMSGFDQIISVHKTESTRALRSTAKCRARRGGQIPEACENWM